MYILHELCQCPCGCINPGNHGLEDCTWKIPSNCMFIQVSRMNKEFKNVCSHQTRLADASLQAIQSKFLESTIPTVEVIHKLC